MTFGELQKSLEGQPGFPKASATASSIRTTACRAPSRRKRPRPSSSTIVRRTAPWRRRKNSRQAEGARAILSELTPARFGPLPRLYVECTDDRSVVLLAQRRMWELVPGAVVKTLELGMRPAAEQSGRTGGGAGAVFEGGGVELGVV
ncbi:hypothetical protein [Roseibium sp.]|uniref:hypothetical protein n=1 Tax=Roseibium sp. TaxID=1936156 RepID=UPI003A9823C4